MLNKHKIVLSWILIISMIFYTKTMFVFADTINISNAELEKREMYINDIEECSSKSNINELFDYEDDVSNDISDSEEPEEDVLVEIKNDEIFESTELVV